jgi:hypothetical protein
VRGGGGGGGHIFLSNVQRKRNRPTCFEAPQKNQGCDLVHFCIFKIESVQVTPDGPLVHWYLPLVMKQAPFLCSDSLSQFCCTHKCIKQMNVIQANASVSSYTAVAKIPFCTFACLPFLSFLPSFLPIRANGIEGIVHLFSLQPCSSNHIVQSTSTLPQLYSYR